ncbi:polysaccharide pyruvyl transferase family protein [Mucilaginibacter sp. JRF]|uniref:polysaccharide pyruvyl transferase family protein n=1 Tax=Mucilaginibacter sp. JRF TaxID=2780088 RepID=UPI00187F04EC|nr:polysaccharide pyruvyl transferase family protein [Mucilaginibacter sp. JRF]MBE9585366.1 polysaccharide pyruvyl transferase family protein [Mucilaginibacter sp. JRF]
MKILHIASFDGNIGDNASHIGFDNILAQVVDGDVAVDQLEIRKFYNNYSLPDKQRFDADLAALANKYDYLFIGGGGFLDFDIKGSVTGTTIALSPEVLDLIKSPIIISSIGSNPRNDIPEGNIDKYRAFLDAFLSAEKNFLAVRNDGSKQVLRDIIGQKYHDAIPEVLDHGFFYENDGSFYKPTPKKYILINTTSDQVHMKNRNIGEVSEEGYITEMGKVINYIIAETDYDIVFAPHIYSDYKAIDNLLKGVNDFYIRTRIAITPYAQGNAGCNQIFSAYRNSELVLGMRFHANVCSIAMDIPSIGLGALDRVSGLYQSMGLSDNAVTVDKPFYEELITKMQQNLAEKTTSPNLQQMKQQTIAAYKQKMKA